MGAAKVIGGEGYHNDGHSNELSNSVCDDERISSLLERHQLIGCAGDYSTSSQKMGLSIRQGSCVRGGTQLQEAMLSSENSINYISNMVETEEENKMKTTEVEVDGICESG